MKTKSPAWLRPAVEYGPLGVFFIAYLKFDLFAATGALMAATAVALAVSYIMERRVPMVLVVTAVVVLVFGGLTLLLDDERFIKMKPTIVQALFAIVLLGGLMLGKPLLKPLLSAAWQLTERGWQLLTLRFGLFFAVMAVANEIVWRTQSTDFWVNYKIFGALALTFAFTASQAPLIMRSQIDPEEPKPDT
ncbi:MAG: septation protein A [Alphaproteobacteria bacterium]|nr:septation protein A [Alphaproteobacteria bacterium]